MCSQTKRPARPLTVLAGIAFMMTLGRSSFGQDTDPGNPPPQIAQSLQAPPRPMGPGPGQAPYFAAPAPEAAAPSAPAPPFGAPATTPSPAPSMLAAALGGEQFAARGGPGFAIADNVGYIDSAIIRSRVRVRYDSAYDNNEPDRAEFFYAKCGCFGNPMMKQELGPKFDRRALGPQHF